MDNQHSVDVTQNLEQSFAQAGLARPMRIERYEPGTELTYAVKGVAPAREASVRLLIDRFVGGGFAGQVYRVKLLEIDAPEGELAGLSTDGHYAMKILIPPLARACRFRNVVYGIGFQGPFSLQCNPAAARAGALWQKFIRRAAGLHFGDVRAVVDIHATFVDETLGSCGEISEWIAGRNWAFEVDDDLDARSRRLHGRTASSDSVGSAEYVAKKRFMSQFVALLHEMGAHEFARQYEWWTCKSQPNVLKRLDAGDDPQAGLTAVDFRAGLALLPMLPMSPGDVPLIGKGLARGSLVQFDRGNLRELRAFADAHAEQFTDMSDALAELEADEREYRDSQVDITHNHVRLLYSGRLWRTIFTNTVTGWRTRNIIDEPTAQTLGRSKLLTFLFFLLGIAGPLGVLAGLAMAAAMLVTWTATAETIALAAGLIVFLPAAARVGRAAWGRGDYRRHYAKMLGSIDYFRRSVRGRIAEKLIAWHRTGRVDGARAERLNAEPWRFAGHLPLSILPAGLHRILTDRAFAAEKLRYVFVRPVRLYFNADAREQWLREMLAEGKRKGMLSDEDAERIASRVKEPFIQKYLKALAVHVCTLPVTQIVSVIVAAVYVYMHPELSWKGSVAAAAGILAAFQITPVSPGSLVRGLYVVYLVIRDRNFKDYNIAVFLGFFKYIGYLAFPIQMAYRYPALARFMAAHWATEAVHFVPVFGEHGALLEHAVFDTFYNRPLTIRRRMKRRAERRAGQPSRAWHILPIALAATGVFALADWAVFRHWGALPTLWNVWSLTILVPLLAGAVASRLAGGMPTQRRVMLAAICGVTVGAAYAIVHAAMRWALVPAEASAITEAELVKHFAGLLLWRALLFTIFAILGALIAETRPVRGVSQSPQPSP